MTLFWKKGFYDTSIQDLIDYLGISNASIYNTFGGKQQLFDQALKLYREINYQGLKNFLATQGDTRVGIRSVFEKIIDDDSKDLDCKGCFIANTTVELIPQNQDLLNFIDHYQKDVVNIFYDFLQKGVDSGQLSPTKDLKTLANFLYTFMMGLRVVGKIHNNPTESLAKVEAMLTLFD